MLWFVLQRSKNSGIPLKSKLCLSLQISSMSVDVSLFISDHHGHWHYWSLCFFPCWNYPQIAKFYLPHCCHHLRILWSWPWETLRAIWPLASCEHLYHQLPWPAPSPLIPWTPSVISTPSPLIRRPNSSSSFTAGMACLLQSWCRIHTCSLPC